MALSSNGQKTKIRDSPTILETFYWVQLFIYYIGSVLGSEIYCRDNPTILDT